VKEGRPDGTPTTRCGGPLESSLDVGSRRKATATRMSPPMRDSLPIDVDYRSGRASIPKSTTALTR
jgi:hypothetical protein